MEKGERKRDLGGREHRDMHGQTTLISFHLRTLAQPEKQGGGEGKEEESKREKRSEREK